MISILGSLGKAEFSILCILGIFWSWILVFWVFSLVFF